MKTPLHVAAQKGLESIVSFLLKNGADADAKDEEEQTALHLAAQNVSLTGKQQSSELQGRTRVVRHLVSSHKELINVEDDESNTPLHIAATHGWEIF